MKKKTTPHLVLNRETIRQLDASSLQGVAGGVIIPPNTNSGENTLCPTVYCSP